MSCQRCGAALTVPPGQAVRCPFCGEVATGAPAPPGAADPRIAALMEDRDGNGIPDVIERMAQGGAQPAGRPLDLGSIPRAPRQPSSRARELVFRYQGSQGVMRLIGVIFLLMGTLFTFIFCWGLPVDLALAIAGEPRDATVVSTEVVSNVKVNGRHPTRIHFRYRLDGGWQEGASSTLDSALLRSAVPGATVPIELLPSAPGWVRVRGSTVSTMGYAGGFVLLFPLVGLSLLISAIRSNRREIRAFLLGTPHAARVVYSGPDRSTRVNGRNPFLLEWAFEVGGRSYKGAISHMDAGALSPLAVSGQIAILYDPGDPATNTVYVA